MGCITEVSVLRRQNNLQCLIVAPAENYVVDLPLDGHSMEDCISRLLESEPEIDANGSVFFSRSLSYQKWNSPDNEIDLLQKNNILMWRVLDKNTNVCHLIPVDISRDLLVEDRLAYLKNAPENRIGLNRAMLRDSVFQVREEGSSWLGGVLDRGFRIHNFERNRRFFDDASRKSAVLLQRDQDLFWGITEGSLDRWIHTTSCFPVNFAEDVPIEDLVHYLKNFNVEVRANPNQHLSVLLKKIIGASRLDPQKVINWNNWALTVINSNTDWEGHAQLVVEGMEDGSYFMHLVHLTNGGRPKSTENVPGVVKYRKIDDPASLSWPGGKTVTWIRERDLVQSMVNDVRWEITMQEQGKPQVYFNALGRDSALVKAQVVSEHDLPARPSHAYIRGNFQRSIFTITPHNCITWVLEKTNMCGVDWEPLPDVNVLVNVATRAKTAIDFAPKVAESFDEYVESRTREPRWLLMKNVCIIS